MQNAGVDRGSVEVDVSETDSSSSDSDENIDRKHRKKRVRNEEALFKKLKNNIAARSNLYSIHSARSHKYGHVQFGPKS